MELIEGVVAVICVYPTNNIQRIKLTTNIIALPLKSVGLKVIVSTLIDLIAENTLLNKRVRKEKINTMNSPKNINTFAIMRPP